jgi:hypothetical protein
MNERILRTAALELQAADNDDIVKVAGIFARIKNWWRAFSSPAYKARVDQLKDQSASLKYMLDTLGESIDSLQVAIKDSDAVLYEESLSTVRDYSLQLAKALVDMHKESVNATNDIPVETKNIEEDSPEAGWVEGLSVEDIAVGKGKPISGMKFFKRFSAADVVLSDEVRLRISDEIIKALVKQAGLSLEQATALVNQNKEAFFDNFRSKFLADAIIRRYEKKPDNIMFIASALFGVRMPNTKYLFDFAHVGLIASTKTLSVREVRSLKISPLSDTSKPVEAGRLDELIKLAGKKQDLIAKHPQFTKEIEEISSQVLPKYLDWGVKELVKGHSLNDIVPTVNSFHQRVGTLQIKDINQYKDLKDLEDLIKGIELKPGKRQEKQLIKSDAKKIYEDQDYVIVRPDSKNACVIYGKNTKWCITMQNEPYYEQYAGSGVVFYFVLRKKPLNDSFDKVVYVYQITGLMESKSAPQYILTNIFDAPDHKIEHADVVSNIGDFRAVIEADLPSAPETAIRKIKKGTATDEEFISYWNAIRADNNSKILSKVLPYINDKYIKLIISDLELLLNDEDDGIRYETVKKLPQEYIIQNADKLLNNKYSDVRYQTIINLPEEYIIQNADKLLNNKYSYVRYQTIINLPEEYIIQNADKLMNNKDSDVRYQTIINLPEEYIIQNADKLMNNKDSYVRDVVKDILHKNKQASRKDELIKLAGAEVERQSTPTTTEQLKQILLSIDDTFSPEAADLFVKHIQFENGANFKSILNNNIGNLTANPNRWQGNYWRPPWYNPGPNASKRDLDLNAKMKAGKAPVAFRAYNSLEDGVKAYVDMVKKTFPSVDKALRSANALAMAEALKTSGYCPDCDPKTLAKHFGIKVEGPSTGWGGLEGQQIAKEDSQQKEQVMAEYKALMQQLTASGPAEKLVKRAIERSTLPLTKVLLAIASDAPFAAQVRYANILSSALRSEIDADVSIHQNGKKIELECDVYGNKTAAINVVDGISGIISSAFCAATKKAGGFVVRANVYTDIKSSEYDILDAQTSETNFRKFAMAMV